MKENIEKDTNKQINLQIKLKKTFINKNLY